MREILFRGKRVHSRQWAFGFYTQSPSGNYYITETACGVASPKTVEPETVGQFTGLTDKNGKKIFEGDVIKFTDDLFGHYYVGVVCFNDGSFCIKYEHREKEKSHRIGQTDKWQDMGASGIATYQYEILGNIHDNPEFLENP